ncbi:hypothetical protein O181_001423 [Austropuccinia psidii MF-1]|uniref:Uncharacterized protein n=1 Tax=Austropuccinia psidii MF-1 TaxID=1389203 RepID=A0A9Q3GBP9_9BASI|nr:hypothetical protein [Austropuccinia psidii MF-1]
MVPKTFREDRRPEKSLLKCNECGITSHLANPCTKKTKINDAPVIEEVQFAEEKEESNHDSKISEDSPEEDYTIENIKAFFEVTKVHTHLQQYSGGCCNLINIKDVKMCKNKPARGKGYASGASCIKSVLLNEIEAKLNLNTLEFFPYVGKDYLQVILPQWKNHLLPIEGVQFISSSNNMYPLSMLDTKMIFPHPSGSMRIKTEIILMDNCTSQHIILGNYYFNICGVYLNNNTDRYFTI